MILHLLRKYSSFLMFIIYKLSCCPLFEFIYAGKFDIVSYYTVVFYIKCIDYSLPIILYLACKAFRNKLAPRYIMYRKVLRIFRAGCISPAQGINSMLDEYNWYAVGYCFKVLPVITKVLKYENKNIYRWKDSAFSNGKEMSLYNE
jgi:hypothetical protein